MRKQLLAIGLLASLAQPLTAMAQNTNTTVEKTQTEMAYTNPISEVALLPVRLVAGVIGAPIGAVTGLFVGFGKGFAWPGHAGTAETTTTTQTRSGE